MGCKVLSQVSKPPQSWISSEATRGTSCISMEKLAWNHPDSCSATSNRSCGHNCEVGWYNGSRRGVLRVGPKTMDCVELSKGEPGSSPSLLKGPKKMTPADFIFVNEAGKPSPRLKALNRQRIRSQARTYSARLFMQRHKTGRRKTEPTETKLLAPQERSYAFLRHNSSCPLTILRRQTLASSESKHPAYSNDLPSRDKSTIPRNCE